MKRDQEQRNRKRRETATEAERRGCVYKRGFQRQPAADRYASHRIKVTGYLHESYQCQYCPLFHIGRVKRYGAYVTAKSE